MYPKFAQGPSAEDGGLPLQLYAGDTPPVSTQDFSIAVTGTAIPQYTPLTRATNGTWSRWTAGNPVHGLAMYDIAVGTSRAAILTAAMLNIDAIAWPPGTTEAQALAAQSADIKYRKLLYSDKRTGSESTLVGPGFEAGPSA